MSAAPDWKNILISLAPILKKQEEVLQAVIGRFDPDRASVLSYPFIFGDDDDMDDMTLRNVGLLRRWQIYGDAPSLAALAASACDKFKVVSPDLAYGVMTAAALAEAEHNQPYHNNLHFKKVLLQTIRIIAEHNQIFEGTSRTLNVRQIAMLLIAACIHDFGHDGKGNTVKGLLVPFRLERQSFELAKPYLFQAGYSDAAELAELEAVLLATDVSPLDDPTSPMRQMKAAYRFHYMGDSKRHEKLNLTEDLSVMEKNPVITQMALILHEADIATSAGLDYATSQYETLLYRSEIGADDARPSHLVDFLNQICQRQFLGDAARKLYSANMARIYALADKDIRAGDEPFPPLSQTEFILGDDDESARAGSIN